MTFLGLQYEKQNQTRSEMGESSFHLEPAIDLLVSYDFGESIPRKRTQLSNETKLNLFLEIRSLMLQQSHSHPSSLPPGETSTSVQVFSFPASPTHSHSFPFQEFERNVRHKGTKRAPEVTPQDPLPVPAKKTKVNGSLAFFTKVSLFILSPLTLCITGEEFCRRCRDHVL